MSYEYGTGQQGLNYPNPYIFQNKFMITKIIFLLILVLYTFVLFKINLDTNENLNGLILFIEFIFAFHFIGFMASFTFKLSKQIRVYFGRGQPASLSPEISENGLGESPQANKLKENIRQGSLIVENPQNGLNGFLYNYLKDLIIAPREIRFLAEHIVYNFTNLSLVFVCFLLSSFLSYGSPLIDWLGIYFMIINLTFISNPLFKKEFNSVDINYTKFIKLFAFSVLIPVILIILSKNTVKLPDISNYHFVFQSFLILMICLGVEFFNFLTLKAQLEKPSNINTCFEQCAVSFNANPNILFGEIERQLQSNWIANIPNRVYTKKINMSSGQSGSFGATIMEESQPMVPQNIPNNLSYSEIINHPKYSKLLISEIISFSLFFFGILGCAYLINNISNNSFNNISWMPLYLLSFYLSIYITKITTQLWGRFDFVSKLFIFEWSGNFVKAKSSFGNKFKDSFQTEKDLFNVESMTLRVWVNQLNSVVFGHGQNNEKKERQVTSMIGLKDESLSSLNHLKTFIENQSLFVKVNSDEDLNRASNLSSLNKLTNQSNSDINTNLLGNDNEK